MTRDIRSRRPTSEELASARAIIRAAILPSPMLHISDHQWLKLESLNPTGSFKIRGALNALNSIDRNVDIVTASAGNHALGVAWAARHLHRNATIVMAESASALKIAKVRELGIEPVLAGKSYDAAETQALELSAAGAFFLSGYNDPYVIAGQASILDEIIDQIPITPDPLTVVVPLGGGGLLAGIVMRVAERSDRDMRVVGVEAEASRAASTAVREGQWVEVAVGETLADGLAGNIEPDSITADIIREHDVELVAVSEARIRDAIRTLYTTFGVVAEGSAAVAYAAMETIDGPAVAIITGRNITWDALGACVHADQLPARE